MFNRNYLFAYCKEQLSDVTPVLEFMSLHFARALSKVSLLIAKLVVLPLWSVHLQDQSFLHELTPIVIDNINTVEYSNLFILMI